MTPLAFYLERPAAIALLPALVAAAILLTARARVARGRRARLGLRVAAAAALGLALAGAGAGGPGRAVRVELLDASASFRARRPAAEAFFDAARERARTGEGGAPERVRIPFAEEPGPLARPDGTDIAAALRAALAAGATDVVLASDGRPTAPGTLEAAAEAARRGVPVHVFLPPRPPGPSLAIESVRVPERARSGESIPVEVAVSWTGARPLDVEMRASAAGDPAERAIRVPVSLPPGGRVAATARLAPLEPGLQDIDIVLDVGGGDPVDDFPEDERVRPAVLVEAPARVLAAGDAPGLFDPRRGGAALGLAADRIDPAAFPSDPAALAAWDAVVIADVPAAAIGRAGLEALARYVEAGGGLLALGARRAFGAGGWADSPLERVLPVSSDPGRSGGRLAVAVALDRSGSMGERAAAGLTKYAAAVRALEGPLARLEPGDLVALVLFSREAEVARALAPLGDPGALGAALHARRTGGQTDIFPALGAAIEAVRGAAAERKHVLLVSDGRSEATPDVRAALGALSPPEDVTVSVVAVGRDADRPLLSRIAEIGRGRFLEARAGGEDFAEVLSRELDPRRLNPVAEGPLEVEGGAPVSHAARARAKPLARVALAIPEVGPLLAEAPAGAGLAVAYASADATPNRAALEAVLRRALRPGRAPGWSLSLSPEGRRLRIEAEAPAAGALAVRLAGRSGAAVIIPLDEVAPRLHRAAADAPREPVLATLIEGDRPRATAVHAPPRPIEHVPSPDDPDLLRAIADTTGGAVLRAPRDLKPPRAPPGGARLPLAPALTLIAAALFLLDLFIEAAILTGRRPRIE